MVLPLSWLRNHSKLGDSGLCFVNARFPYLLCHFSMCIKILLCSGSYMYACDTYIALSIPLFLLTSHLVWLDVDVRNLYHPKNTEMLMPSFFVLKKRFLNCNPNVGGYSVLYILHIALSGHHSRKPTLPLSLPPSNPPLKPQPPLPLLFLEDTVVTRCRWCGWR